MRKATSIILPGCSLLCRRLLVCAGLQLSGSRARRLGFVRSPKSGRSHTPRVTLRRRSRIIKWHGTQIANRVESRRTWLPGRGDDGQTPGRGAVFSVSSVTSCFIAPALHHPLTRFLATFPAVFLCMGWRPVAPPRIRKRTRCILQEQTEKESLFPPVQPKPP